MRWLKARPVFWTHSLLSIIDQVVLSGLNFAVGMCLIRFGTKSDYGLYSQLFAASLFAVGMQDALIGSPLTTLAPHLDDHERALTIRRLQAAQRVSGSLLGLVFGLGAAVYAATSVPGVTAWAAGAAFAFFVLATSLREYRRSLWFIHSDLQSLLRSDLAYALLSLAGGGAAIALHQVGAVTVLCILGSAHALAMTVGKPEAAVEPRADSPSLASTLGRIWEKGRWALPGAVVGWAGNYSFLYLASAMSGVEAAAEVSASRLLLVPVGLLVVAWSRVARPVAGRLIHARDWPGLNRLTWRSWSGLELLSCLYIGVLMVALPWLQAHVLGAKYQGLGPLVWAWGGYFVFSVARTIATTWLISIGAFRQLFIEGCVVVVFMVAVSSVLIPAWGALGAVCALIVMEAFDTVLLLLMIRWQRQRLNREEPSHA